MRNVKKKSVPAGPQLFRAFERKSVPERKKLNQRAEALESVFRLCLARSLYGGM
jgi:hypothetical protein